MGVDYYLQKRVCVVYTSPEKADRETDDEGSEGPEVPEGSEGGPEQDDQQEQGQDCSGPIGPTAEHHVLHKTYINVGDREGHYYFGATADSSDEEEGTACSTSTGIWAEIEVRSRAYGKKKVYEAGEWLHVRHKERLLNELAKQGIPLESVIRMYKYLSGWER